MSVDIKFLIFICLRPWIKGRKRQGDRRRSVRIMLLYICLSCSVFRQLLLDEKCEGTAEETEGSEY